MRLAGYVKAKKGNIGTYQIFDNSGRIFKNIFSKNDDLGIPISPINNKSIFSLNYINNLVKAYLENKINKKIYLEAKPLLYLEQMIIKKAGYLDRVVINKQILYLKTILGQLIVYLALVIINVLKDYLHQKMIIKSSGEDFLKIIITKIVEQYLVKISIFEFDL